MISSLKGVLGTLALLVALTASPASADVAPPPPPAVPEEAAGLVIAYLENFNAGSAEGILSTYSDNPGFVWVENGHVTYLGKAEAVAGMAKAMSATKGYQLKTSMDEVRVVVTGPDSMFATVPLKVSTPSGMGKEVTADGVLTMTLLRENGAWSILTGHMATQPAP